VSPSAPSPARDIGSAAFECSPDCVKLLDLDGRLLRMNVNGQCLMEIDDFSTVAGSPWHALWPCENQDRVRRAVDTARSGAPDRFYAYCPTARGTAKWWDVSVAPVLDSQGRPEALVSVSRDVTELHLAREREAEAAARLRFVLQAAHMGDWELDLATGEARTSVLHDAMFGYPQGVGQWSVEVFLTHVHPKDLEGVRAALERAMLDGALSMEFRAQGADGRLRWLRVQGRHYHPVPHGPATKMLGTVVDITEQKSAEQALAEALDKAAQSASAAQAERARLDALLDAAPVGIGYADASGRLMLVNAANKALWGEHPLSSNVDEYVEWKGWWADGSARHGQRLKPGEWGLARALGGELVRGDMVEIEPFHAPGTRRTVWLLAAPVRGADQRIDGAVVVQLDITDQVRAEQALRTSEAKFRTITEAMPQMVWSALPDGYHDFYNRRWYEYTGVPEGSTDGEAWNGMFHPDDQPLAWERWRHSLSTGEVYEIEYRLRHHSGQYRWVLGRALPVRNEQGEIVRWMGTCTDIHEQKLAQEALKASEESLRQADRRKDEFLAMLAHELRNPLAPIRTAGTLLRMGPADAQRTAQAAAIISRQVNHLTEIVDDLLDVSRVTRGLVQLDLEVFDAKLAIQAALEQVRPLIEERQHRLTLQIDEPALWVRGDRTRMTQVVANLLNNAAKYTTPGGQLRLEATRHAGQVAIEVRDNGIGIDATLLPHVFELFTQGQQALDRAQGGLGIGLALVRRLVQLHGGEIHAHSDGPGCGSRFTVRVPAAPAPAVAPDSPAPTGPAEEGPQRVVIVDDNPDAASTLAALLQMRGHDVSTFPSAEDALQAEPTDADAYVLDIGLPGMTGHDLAHRLRELTAGRAVRLFALSGYGQPADRERSTLSGFDEHFVKPVDPARLLRALEKAPPAR